MKKMLVYLVTLSILLIVSACSSEEVEKEPDQVVTENQNNNSVITNNSNSNSNSSENNTSKPTKSENELESIVKHFEKNGYSIGEKSVKIFEMVQAKDGFAIEINGSKIEFYLYDSKSEVLKEMQSTGQYDMNGFVLDAVTNGNIAMIAHRSHPESDKIIETFNSYK